MKLKLILFVVIALILGYGLFHYQNVKHRRNDCVQVVENSATARIAPSLVADQIKICNQNYNFWHYWHNK